MTGATSFLGRNLIQNLANDGNMVTALVRSESANYIFLPKNDNIRYIELDLQHLEELVSHVEKADVFIHFAWGGAGKTGRYDYDIQEKNIEYGMSALKIASLLGCNTFVFSGSQAEYGMKEEKVDEKTECNPLIAYGYSKYEFSKKADKFCEKNGIRFLHLRIFSVYGPGDRDGTLIDMCLNYFNNGKYLVLGECKQLWNYLYIDDFSEMVNRLIKSNCEAGIYNIASSDTRILRDFVLEIYDLSNKSGSFGFVDTTQTEDKKVVLNPDITKVTKAINWNPHVVFSQGIQNILKYKNGESN